MTRRVGLPFLILLSVLGMPQAAVAQPAQSFRPGFGWRAGLRIDATETRAGVLREAAVSDSGRVSTATYEIIVTDHPDGLLIQHRGIRVERAHEFASGVTPMERVNEVLADQLEYWLRLPDLVVSERGEYIRLDDLDGFRSRLEGTLRPLASSLAGGDERILPLVDDLLAGIDDETIESYAVDRWSSLADKWAFTDWEIGQVYGAEIEAPNPLVPGPAIPYEIQAGLTRMTDCAAPSGGVLCAVFVMVTRPADRALGEAARSLADSLGAQLLAAAGPEASPEYRDGTTPALTFEEMSIQERVELMTDPVTLLPLWLEERRLRAGRGLGLGEPFSFYAEEVRTTEFAYTRSD